MRRDIDPQVKEILQLLDEQHRLQQRWPYTAEILERDRELSTRIRELCDELCPGEKKIRNKENSRETAAENARSLLSCA